MNKKYILSYGGGVNSSALYFYILEKGLPLDLVIFSDTQEESKETYDSVKRMKVLCNANYIEFITVTNGSLYDYYYKKKAVMSMMMRDCTSKFKISPIRRYIRNRFGKSMKFGFYIGIAYDEIRRIRESDVKYIQNIYPFCDDKITRLGNYKILDKYNFKAKKSGCKGCMFQKKIEWLNLRKSNPEEFKRHLDLEENNKRYPEILLNGTFPLRSIWEQKSLEDFDDIFNSCNSVNGGCFL